MIFLNCIMYIDYMGVKNEQENIYFIIFHVYININVCCFCSGFG